MAEALSGKVDQESEAGQTAECVAQSEEEKSEDRVDLSQEDGQLLSPKGKRKSYQRETKLEAVQYYHQCNNKYKTAKMFGISPATLRGWLQNQERITSSSRGAKKIGSGRKAFWPDMEEDLYRQYRQLKGKGLTVKSWWFEAQSRELMNMMHPEVDFKFSGGWLAAFKKRNNIHNRC